MRARTIVGIAIVAALTVLSGDNAFGFGEVFRVEVKTTEYCANSGKEKITWENASELWLMVNLDPLSLVNSGRIIITLSPDPDFDDVFEAVGALVEYEPNAFAFWVILTLGDLDESAFFYNAQGTWEVDPGTSTIQGIKFKYTGLERVDGVDLCFGTGKIRTVERIR